MEISWQGETCLWVQAGNDVLVVDSFKKSLITSKKGTKAGIVAFTYGIVPNGLPGSRQILLDSPGEFEIGKFYVTGVGTPHTGPDDERDVNIMYSIRADGVTICHLGHLDRIPSTKSIDLLGQPDVVFILVERNGPLVTSQIAEIIGRIGPKIVVPLLPSRAEFNDDTITKELVGLLGVADSETKTRLNVIETNLPRDLSLIILEHATP